jgi:site-specific DNA-methyltransferase (adenine-specific)
MWLYGTGFPKSLNISNAIDKKKGAEREIIGRKKAGMGSGKTFGMLQSEGLNYLAPKEVDITAPTTPEAKMWEGYGTALKPAYEPILMAMKPNEGSYAENALKWGVAGLNIDGARIPTNETWKGQDYKGHTNPSSYLIDKDYYKESNPLGRFPANILLDEASAEMLDRQSGIVGSGRFSRGSKRHHSFWDSTKGKGIQCNAPDNYGDVGGASRFFYVAKASKGERNMGLEELEPKIGGGLNATVHGDSRNGRVTIQQNNHPTVKPLKLMEYLVRLTSMPNENQVYLDPFLGSGTTAMACRKLGKYFIGIEINPEYIEIAKRRIEAVESGIFKEEVIVLENFDYIAKV